MEDILDEDILYRRVPRSPSHWDDIKQEPKSSAFTLRRLKVSELPEVIRIKLESNINLTDEERRQRFEEGLSVDLARLTTIDRCRRGDAEGCVVVGLQAGAIRKLGFTIRYDPIDRSSPHFNEQYGENFAHSLILDNSSDSLSKSKGSYLLKSIWISLDQKTGEVLSNHGESA